MDEEEIEVVDEVTGARKAQKLARFDLIPPVPMWEVARHYGVGARKYSENNWMKGYKWSLSIAALERHINLFKQGESIDPENNTHHLAAAVFHCLTLIEYEDTHPEQDDRGNMRRDTNGTADQTS
jgi:hypothetical protein